MRYRPFGISGKAVSAVSLLLRDSSALPTAHACRSLVLSAMECGMNAFEVAAGSELLAQGLNAAMSAVERRLLFVTWRICGDGRRTITPEMISQSVRAGLQRTGAGYFDLLMLDELAYETLAADATPLLQDLRAGGLALQVGISGSGATIDACIDSAAFDVLSTPFNLTSDTSLRRRIKEASARNMALIASDVFAPEACRPIDHASVKGGLFRRRPQAPAPASAYDFLHHARGWTAEELCLGYVLTEPAFATVQIETARLDVLERMAAVADRDLPTGMAAQIEMARFDAGPQARSA